MKFLHETLKFMKYKVFVAKTNLLFLCPLLQVEETLKKKRTFKKYTYRGVDLDQLLDMPK